MTSAIVEKIYTHLDEEGILFFSFGEVFRDVNIRIGIFHGNLLSPLVFDLGLTPLGSVLQKAKAVYDFSENKEKNKYLLFIIYSKNKKQFDSLVDC